MLFLVCTNNLSKGLQCRVKLVNDDTSIFSVVHDPVKPVNAMNKDLRFNPGRSKQAQEVIFSWKTSTISHSCLTFNSTYFQKAASQKHLGMVLDSKLNFKKHISQKIDKANKEIVITRKLRSVFPRSL